MMKHCKSTLTLRLSAAAVAVALGASSALAQQQSGDDPARQAQPRSGAQQGQSAAQPESATPRNQSAAQSQSGAQQPGQAAANRGQSGDGGLDKVVQMHGDLGTFVEALETAGLVDSLTDGTKYTIFAPTNQAFESLQQDVAELLKPENRQDLVALLRTHIVADDVDPQMARQLSEAKTIDGGTVALSEENGKLMIGEASVVTPDIQEGALRIYAIDKVLGDGRLRTASAPDDRDRG